MQLDCFRLNKENQEKSLPLRAEQSLDQNLAGKKCQPQTCTLQEKLELQQQLV